MNGIMYVLSTGCQWRAIPKDLLRAYDSVGEARASIGRYLNFYNPASQHPSAYAIEVNRVC